MDIQNETLRNITLSEYALGLSGDADLSASLSDNRAALAQYVSDGAEEYDFLVCVLDTVYAITSRVSPTRQAAREAFISECAALGFANPTVVADMADSLREIRTETAGSAKHDLLAPTLVDLAGVYKALAILYYRSVLYSCLNMRMFSSKRSLLKSAIAAMRAYIASGMDAYAVATPEMFAN